MADIYFSFSLHPIAREMSSGEFSRSCFRTVCLINAKQDNIGYRNRQAEERASFRGGFGRRGLMEAAVGLSGRAPIRSLSVSVSMLSMARPQGASVIPRPMTAIPY